jgi:DNA-binding NtrC family response regulator
MANAIHRASGLKGKFVPLNVAGLDPLMFDDTLFGHKKGAFTGAAEPREGLIVQAQGGTLFLDEIGDLCQQSQVKLLRLLQENEYYRLGSDLMQRSNARIIAASNRDFTKLVADGVFREDLYHRLCYHHIHIPPLRERTEDIIPLARHFARQVAVDIGAPVPRISAELQVLLTQYSFPGNVRELMLKIVNAIIANRPALLTQIYFPDIVVSENAVLKQSNAAKGQFSLHVVFPEFPEMEKVEQIMLVEALKITGGRKGYAADLLGVTRQTLNTWLKRMDD